ncbi:hypothetical protein QZM22_02775 [Burkholderia oklahomensis]|uniref:hypothetical protein n=1 Tax=Burkholderia oklahomensis TaxID=342113 RepID=UPI0026560583|nr:hypothetical protein [Burkholderia oklahomensis]MDN7671471.1 hypothetical protein [Burkholderia oklahomensis]
MRFLAAYSIYRQASAGLPSGRGDKIIRFYMSKKIEPVLASGNYPGNSVFWRDTLFEMSDQFCVWSEKWKGYRPLGWEEFAKTLSSTEAGAEVLRFCAKQIAETLLQTINPRLALIGIYMIDLVDDIDPPAQGDIRWIPLRQRLVSFLREHYASRISIYSQKNGINDLQQMTGETSIGPVPQTDSAYPKEVSLATSVADGVIVSRYGRLRRRRR